MKYNLSNIMKKEHEFRMVGINKSESLKNAWAIEKLEISRFMLSMKDRWNREDYAWDREAVNELSKLNRALNVVASTASKESAPIVSRVALTDAERTEVYDEINRLTNLNWDYSEGEVNAEHQSEITALWEVVYKGRIVADVKKAA